ncbi:MAG: hypothetical protein LQ349_000508 [Xanthoria aureola]|nr:MAG: hypothetical protein LQ349_000508 [Xanthoria aureola]
MNPVTQLYPFSLAGPLTEYVVMRPKSENIEISESKLSQDELAQLMKSTHFDKKELQQWYKGTKEPARRRSEVARG